MKTPQLPALPSMTPLGLKPAPAPMMRETLSHTPGPWSVELDGANAVIIHSDKERMLRSHIAKLYDYGLCPEHGTVEANAQLIAAAPELIAALEGVRQHYATVSENGAMMVAISTELYMQIEAALAKARGEA